MNLVKARNKGLKHQVCLGEGEKLKQENPSKTRPKEGSTQQGIPWNSSRNTPPLDFFLLKKIEKSFLSPVIQSVGLDWRAWTMDILTEKRVSHE